MKLRILQIILHNNERKIKCTLHCEFIQFYKIIIVVRKLTEFSARLAISSQRLSTWALSVSISFSAFSRRLFRDEFSVFKYSISDCKSSFFLEILSTSLTSSDNCFLRSSIVENYEKIKQFCSKINSKPATSKYKINFQVCKNLPAKQYGN